MNIVISVRSQTLYLLERLQCKKQYRISTSRFGISCMENSFGTPIGRFVVDKKIGSVSPKGAVFKGRVPTGEVWMKSDGSRTSDLILSRILWLSGLEAHNMNTKSRYIYIHGTNHEGSIGNPSSQGCVRMTNDDVMDLFDLVSEGDEVRIV